MQADKKREDEKTARDTENNARRAMVNQMHDKAQVSATIQISVVAPRFASFISNK